MSSELSRSFFCLALNPTQRYVVDVHLRHLKAMRSIVKLDHRVEGLRIAIFDGSIDVSSRQKTVANDAPLVRVNPGELDP